MRALAVVLGLFACLVGGCGSGGGNNNDNAAPTADAGADQNVATGSTVTLDGSASTDADGDLLSYSWSVASMPVGSGAVLSDSNAVKPTFIADMDGDYVLSLVVNDGKDSSKADSVTVTAATANSAPVANAGPDQNVATGSTVTLDGSASSDADGDLLSYSWSLTSKPAGSSAVLSDSNAVKPSFIADLDGVYVWSLAADDGALASASDSVTVTAATPNSAPVANAGPDQNVSTGSTVTLDGSASSDADGDPLTYSWAIVSLPPGSNAILLNDSTVSPTFIADLDGNYVISLVVNDGTVNSTTDNVTVTAATPNSAPVANAGPDQNVAVGSIVPLDGSASSDADGDSLTYTWSLLSMPPGSNAFLLNWDIVAPTFTADLAGDYVLNLVVNDGTVASMADTVTVTAKSTYTFGSTSYIQYRTYESVLPVYRTFLPMTKDGFPIDPATDIASVRLFDSSNNLLTALGGGLNLETYMYLNCMVQPCVQSGPINENGVWGGFADLPADTYRFEVDTSDGQTLNLDMSYPGQLVLPFVSNATMQSSWVGSDLVLNWTNPVGSANWAEVDELRIILYDENVVSLLYIRLDPTAETVTINASLLGQSIAQGNGTLATWEIQTRAYDVNSMNFARAVTNRVNIVAPVP